MLIVFITSRLDYCNGLFANCSMAVRQRLQRIQNSAARLVYSEPALSHVTVLYTIAAPVTLVTGCQAYNV